MAVRGGRGGGRGRDSRGDRDRGSKRIGDWIPKTALGNLVAEGKVTTMSDAIATRLRIREPEIVDILLPDVADEVIDVNMVQRMTDSGRRVRFAITVVVGNSDGYVGLGRARGKEVGPAIRKAIDSAKLSIVEIKRGCGSWECGCGKPHTFPFEVIGKSGSVDIEFKPAPRGVGLAVSEIPRHVLRLAGIKDAWSISGGHTKTTVNYGLAAFDAMRRTASMRVTQEQATRLKIISGAVEARPIGLDAQTAAKLLDDAKRREKLREKEKLVSKMISAKVETSADDDIELPIDGAMDEGGDAL
jgi:small subunit ribosomal protein S5